MSHFALNRRRFLASTALGAAAVMAPAVLRAQGAAVKVGILQPVSGAMSYSGQQGRLGATLALEEINAGGIKSLGGRQARSGVRRCAVHTGRRHAEVEKMNAAGVAAVVGGYVSSICLAASQTAARYDLPYIVDVGVADSIVTRGLKNTFRFGPGFGIIAKTAIDNLITLNDAAGKIAKTVMIVHEDSAFGSGLAKLLNTQLPEKGFQVIETIPHPTPTRDFNNVVTKIRAANPDLVIPADYYNEYVCSRVHASSRRCARRAIYSVARRLPASSYKFVKEFPEAAEYIMDCNHLFDPKNPKALDLKKKVEGEGRVLHLRGLHELLGAAAALADALREAASADPREDHRGAREASTFSGPRDALRSDQVRQRPEPGRRAGQYAGHRQRHPGDLPGAVRFGRRRCFRCRGVINEPFVPAKAGTQYPQTLDSRLRGNERRLDCSPQSSSSRAILNGLLTVAVYALVALGLTLIYGVLHIINFAHGAILTVAMFAAFFAHRLLGLDPYLAAVRADAAVLLPRLCVAALRHRSGRAWRGPQHPAGHARLGGRDRERAALRVPRRHPHRQPALRLRGGRSRPGLPERAARDRVLRRGGGRAGALAADALHRHRQGDPRRRQGKARRAIVRIDVAHIYAVTFGLGTACLAIAACLLLPTYYVNSARGQRLRAHRLHHRGARRHGLGPRVRWSAACSPAWWKACPDFISANRSARSAFS
jgi:branched-chain amino acid transport system substrate-binding protein